MYRLANIIPNDIALNLIPEVSFNPSGSMFAVSHQRTNEVVVFDSHTRSVLRVYRNPDSRLDSPHGILLTHKHMVVSNTHGNLRPSSFTVYPLTDASDKPVSVYETPWQHLREAHSLALHNDILAVTYCENVQGPGAIVAYRFDDEAGLIKAPIAIREAVFDNYGEPKGVAFNSSGSNAFCTYTTQKRMTGLAQYARRLKAARMVWKRGNVVAFCQYIWSKSVKRIRTIQAPSPVLNNGIAIFAIASGGVFSEEPITVLTRQAFCRLENIAIVGDTAVLSDTINGMVHVHDLASDPLLEAPIYTITENLTLPHGAKLSPDQKMLVITNYGLKAENDIIHWMTPTQDGKNSVLVYDLHEA